MLLLSKKINYMYTKLRVYVVAKDERCFCFSLNKLY